MLGQLQFDKDRAFYIGLNKVADARVAGAHLIPDQTYTSKAKLKAAGAVTPAGVVGSLSTSSSVESGVSSIPVTDSADRAQLLAIAPQVFSEVSKRSVTVNAQTEFALGQDYLYAGLVRFQVRTHDDFREPDQLETAPRLGLWLIEIPDTEPAHEAQSVTWIVLSGTAEGQLKTTLGGSVSEWRGGSQTEHLFELLTEKMAGRARKDNDDRWLRDPYYVRAARNLLSTSIEQRVEMAFLCLEVHDCPTSGDGAEVSFLDWTPASTSREVPVSKVVLGTPYFVQFSNDPKRELSDQDRSLWQRFKEFLGFGE